MALISPLCVQVSSGLCVYVEVMYRPHLTGVMGLTLFYCSVTWGKVFFNLSNLRGRSRGIRRNEPGASEATAE